MAMEMDTASSAGERLLDPEQYEHEEKGEGLSVSHKRRGAFMSVVMGQFLQQRLSWRFILRLKSLVPSFALASTRKQHAVVHSQLKDTSYMDGLRGIACWCVFVGHVWRPWMNYPVESDNWDFGFASVPGDYDLIQLPVVRAIYSGTFMVQIFFVLSGYVLSLKPLSLIRSHNNESLMDYLSAAVFRRAFRLFLPLAAAQFIVYMVVYSGNYGTTFIGTDFAQGKEGLWLQFADYWWNILSQLNPFIWHRQEPPYMAQLWTIPVEFRGSIIVYIILVAMAKVKPVVRLTSLCLFVLYCMSVEMLDIADFVCGMILAEASLIRKDSTFDVTSFYGRYATSHTIQRVRTVFWTSCNLIALWFGTYPLREGQNAWSYSWYSTLIPSTYQESDWSRAQFSIFCGAVLLLIALENCKPLQRPFTTVVAQYLGKISFSLYIVHQPLALCFNREVATYIFGAISNHLIAYCVAMVAVSVTTLWVSDIFWRLIDTKSIQAARVIRKWCEVK